MSKKYARSILLVFVGALALNLYAEVAWTTGSCAPSEWTALERNLLVGKVGVAEGQLSYLAKNISSLTDGKVPDPVIDSALCGFCNGTKMEWNFDGPKTLEKIRLSAQTYWSGRQYHRINVTLIEVKHENSSDWQIVDAPELDFASDAVEGNVPNATLENSESGVIAEGVVAIRLTFGTRDAYAYYCAEIEVIGNSELSGPVCGEIDVTPAKTKATISGLISDVGGDATACSVYLSLDDAAPIKIAKSVSDSFEYYLEGLAPGTTYSYALSVSNNAPTVKGVVKEGQFTTLAEDARTTIWKTSEGVPDDFEPMEKNLLFGMTGTTSGTISGYGGGVDLLTNAEVSGETKQTCGFYEGATVAWEFDSPKSLGYIRFTTCFTAGYGMYDDIKISKIEVKTLDSDDSWEVLDVEPVDYAGSGKEGTALFATLCDIENGFIVLKATALRITFAKPINVAQYYAEIEATEYVPESKPGFTVIVR